MNYTEFEKHLLVASYLLIEETGRQMVNVRDVLGKYQLHPKPNWIMRALSSFKDQGYIKDQLHTGGELDQHVYLSASGAKEAEYLINSEDVTPLEIKAKSSSPEGRTEDPYVEAGYVEEDYFADAIPAADRIVGLNHNSPEYSEIADRLAALYEEARGCNTLGESPEERNRIVVALKVANDLWKAAELKVIQIRVGVILALEDAQPKLTALGKGVGISLLIDMIKSFVKQAIGIDL